ncbi:MAG: hypothetical protein PHH06_01185 [Candidatus Gracilibacteria bacterium]|nr:hypothetical protein [Candidatus Gracilibacteria bacterium]
MNLPEIIKEKKRVSEIITQKYNFSKNKTLGYISLDSNIINDDFLNGLSVLPANFIINSKTLTDSKHKNITFSDKPVADVVGLDFILCDDCESNMSTYFTAGVSPVVSRNNVVANLLSEFNPGKVTGNAYIFENDTKWEIYYALVRYLENFKFPYDNKALIKNVLEI